METADQVLGAHTVRTLVTYLLPVKFCERLRLDPKLIKTLNLHKLLGAAWLPAMERRAADYRGVLESNGRVVQVNFSKRPATNLQVGPKLNAAILTLE